MTSQDTLRNSAAWPEPEPLGERPFIVYEKDVNNPVFMHKLSGIKRPVYWTTQAVAALVAKIQKGE